MIIPYIVCRVFQAMYACYLTLSVALTTVPKGRLRLKCDGTRAETRFCLSAKRTSPFNPLNADLNPICHLLTLLGAHHILHISRRRVKSAGAPVQSTTGMRGVCISGCNGSNAGYTMWGSAKGTGYPLHSTVPPSFPLAVRHCVPSHFNWTLELLVG